MQDWEIFLNKEVVIDTKSSYLFIGTLDKVNDSFLALLDVDVHDHSEFSKTKEVYILEAAKYGIKKNREKIHVVKTEVVCISLLEDVIRY